VCVKNMVIKPSSTRKYQTLKDLQIVRPTKELPVKYSGMELGSVALKNKHSTAVINTQHTPSSRVRGAPANDPYRQVRKGRSGIKTQHVVTGDAGERNHTSVASVAGRRRRSAESARAALRAPGGGWARGAAARCVACARRKYAVQII